MATVINPAAVVPSAEEIREELEKILNNPIFRKRDNLRNFLRYIVELKVGGNDRVKEYVLGVEVFGRGKSFDPRLDPIVRVEARRLRLALSKYYENAGKQSKIRIEVPKGGYSVEIQKLPDPSELGITAVETSKHIALSRSEATISFLKSNKAAISLPLVLAILLAGYLVVGRPAGGSARRTPPAVAASIAVLPFVSLGDDKSDDSLPDGLAEELIDSLAHVPGLHVIARESSFQFKDRAVDIREIGRQLNALTVLTGSIRSQNKRLRITAHLNDSTTGYELWSETYDLEQTNFLDLQRDISQAITNALGVKLADSNTPYVFHAPAPRVNPEAYRDYLRGRYFIDKFSPASTKLANSYFEQAIREDPNFALAHAGLANCYGMEWTFNAAPTSILVPKIKAEALKALALDSSLGEAHIMMAVAKEPDLDWPGVGREFRRAVDLTPGDARARKMYSYYFQIMGRFDEALKQATLAQEVDPISPGIAQTAASVLYYERRFDEAMDAFRKALMFDPQYGLAHRGLGVTYVQAGMYSQGIAELEAAARLASDPLTQAYLGYGYGRSGDTARAKQVLRKLLNQPTSGPPLALSIAILYLGLGDKDSAFTWLGTVVDQRSVFQFISGDPIYDQLRSDPRFAGLLHRMNLDLAPSAASKSAVQN